jgi:hypothetical protein
MRLLRSTVLLLFLPFLLAVAFADDGPKKANIREKLVGTWKLVSARYGGEEFTFPEGVTVVKHVTPAQFMTVIYDKDGKVLRAAGGSCKFEGEDQYQETPEYGTSENFQEIKGKVQVFSCMVDGNNWRHEGKLSNGLLVEEVYVRVESK